MLEEMELSRLRPGNPQHNRKNEILKKRRRASHGLANVIALCAAGDINSLWADSSAHLDILAGGHLNLNATDVVASNGTARLQAAGQHQPLSRPGIQAPPSQYHESQLLLQGTKVSYGCAVRRITGVDKVQEVIGAQAGLTQPLPSD